MKKHGIGTKMLLVRGGAQLLTHGGKLVCQYVFHYFHQKVINKRIFFSL